MKGTDLQTANDEVLSRGLDVLDGMVRRMEDGHRIEIADAAATLEILRACGEQPRPAPAFESEEQSLVVMLEDALKTKRAVDFVRDSRRLSGLLRNHLKDDRPPTAEEDRTMEFRASLIRLERKYAPQSHSNRLAGMREPARVR
jgi:hypothetical protein